ncbi:hypothetical protein NE237_005772 [Protea cynaroides]|uniref:Uncharacterized protein n=1 Tax=Protea cynaroides TaxID=273540 RepID=A0A9Q0QUP5_9MAGN|nr:hypothetical protein NE237_005772 [Protea cynaroides]
MTNKARKNSQSFRDKSKKLVSNITEVPVIYVAEKSLGTKPGSSLPAPASTRLVSIPIMDGTSFTSPYIPESRRSQEPESSSRTSSHLMELPAEEIYVINEGVTNVDGRASNYIKLFHERILSDSRVK